MFNLNINLFFKYVYIYVISYHEMTYAAMDEQLLP